MLRIAVLAMTEPAGAGFLLPRAFLRVGGASLARHQLSLALTLDCQRVICIAHNLGAELISLQHDAEAAGIQFHVVHDSRGLARLVTAGDDVIVLADGLLVDVASARVLLNDGAAVLTQPVEAGLAAGFERIDLNNATAGAMHISGRFIDALANLPPDCDVVSALTRIALQGGVPMKEVPGDLRSGVRWRLVRDEAESHAIEGEWLRVHLGGKRSPAPGAFMARWLVQRMGPSLLHGGSASRAGFGAALALALLALILAWFRMTGAGLMCCAIASVLVSAGNLLRQIERSVRGDHAAPIITGSALGWLVDAAIVTVIVRDWPLQPWQTIPDVTFAPVVLLLTIRLLARALPQNLVGWTGDRVVLCIVLSLAWPADLLGIAVQLLAVILSLAGIVLGGGGVRLTRD